MSWIRDVPGEVWKDPEQVASPHPKQTLSKGATLYSSLRAPQALFFLMSAHTAALHKASQGQMNLQSLFFPFSSPG